MISRGPHRKFLRNQGEGIGGNPEVREALEEREGPPEARQEEKRLRNELLKD